MEEQQARESQADLARMQAVRGHALARETAEAAGNTHRAMLNEGIHFATSSRKHLEAVGALRTHMEPSMRQAASDIFDAAGAIMDEKERTQQGLPPGPSGNSSGEPKRCHDCGLTTHLRGSRLCEHFNPEHSARGRGRGRARR